MLQKPDAYGGMGAYAAVSIKKGELIEKGVVRVVPTDGNDCPFVFTWSKTEPRQWACGSGASMFYNMSAEPNTHMERCPAPRSPPSPLRRRRRRRRRRRCRRFNFNETTTAHCAQPMPTCPSHEVGPSPRWCVPN